MPDLVKHAIDLATRRERYRAALTQTEFELERVIIQLRSEGASEQLIDRVAEGLRPPDPGPGAAPVVARPRETPVERFVPPEGWWTPSALRPRTS